MLRACRILAHALSMPTCVGSCMQRRRLKRNAPAGEASTSGEANAHLPECIQYAARMVEALLSNGDTSRLFVQRSGLEHLLAMYSLPKLPPTFGSSSPSHALMAALRTRTTNAKHAAKLLCKELTAQLEKATSVAEVFPLSSGELPLPRVAAH